MTEEKVSHVRLQGEPLSSGFFLAQVQILLSAQKEIQLLQKAILLGPATCCSKIVISHVSDSSPVIPAVTLE
ncbi:hypothetical protein M0412_03200 [Agrobacterium sp. O3.4]|uniref:Uncharacterized protein n=1 Tax=Agrobacterium cucumeris TaxID=2862866 RepID=A0ABY8RJ62_9HYPH|nr:MULTISPECIES: hypothetical protein [Rhizobium/Agrobacterium group]MCZ7472581.1 hypothetical protein [Rhizobium rhizogenes]WHO07082.1 hypothetical protein KZ699_08140 [Agrobacterium cucumeris]